MRETQESLSPVFVATRNTWRASCFTSARFSQHKLWSLPVPPRSTQMEIPEVSVPLPRTTRNLRLALFSRWRTFSRPPADRWCKHPTKCCLDVTREVTRTIPVCFVEVAYQKAKLQSKLFDSWLPCVDDTTDIHIDVTSLSQHSQPWPCIRERRDKISPRVQAPFSQ